MKKIGILTSGGDCPGLNAVIRAVTVHATVSYGWQVIGIHQGGLGLLNEPMRYDILTPDFNGHGVNILRTAGTILGSTTHGNPFSYPMPDGGFEDRSERFIEGYYALGLEALIGVGGDGSLRILRKLAQKGNIPLICIPKTIDNDIPHTKSLGFVTAVEVATQALDRLQPTAASHNRVMILEVMGRDAGHIALQAGIAGGADIILIPEIPFKLEHIVQKIRALQDEGRNFALIVVSEAVKTEEGESLTVKDAKTGRARYSGIGHYLEDRLATLTGADVRVTVLGHVQRGGQPTWQDRVLASAFGVHAVDLIAQGKSDCMVAWENEKIMDVPLDDAMSSANRVRPESDIVKTARGLGVSFGDEAPHV